MVFSNVVQKPAIRKVQLEVLELLSEALQCSFGPMGSNTLVLKENTLNKYTKDGFSILEEIKVKGMLEDSVVKDIKDIVRNIIVEFGDNSTSAIILCYLIFKELVNIEENFKDIPPYKIVQNFREAVESIKEEILRHGRECTVDDIYNIAYTSSNGNTDIAQNIRDIYADHGMDVFIDVSVSPSNDSQLKIYDGLTLRSGYGDAAYVNIPSKDTAEVYNPHIYVFDDPIDNAYMMSLFDTIIEKNIYTPMSTGQIEDIVPTVILCKHISRDMSGIIRSLVEFMYTADSANKPPFLLVPNIYDEAELDDIAMLCGAPLIKKYINKEVFDADIASGKAPTPATIETFYGTCEVVESDAIKTKFKTPAKMKNEDGTYTDTYKALVSNLESALAKMKDNGEDSTVIGKMKRRINSLKANMVEYFIGGISVSDRDSIRDLVEDSVLNCRSAARHGVGNAANFEGYRASVNTTSSDSDINTHIVAIRNAYHDITSLLYSTVLTDAYKVEDNIKLSLEKGKPLNLRTLEYDGMVLTSIMSDVSVLDAISKIITIMFTCNQALLQNPLVNNYIDTSKIS